MINRIKSFLAGRDADSATAGRDDRGDLKVAAAALLVEAARMDATVATAERETIKRLIRERFSLSVEEAEDLVAHAESRAETSVQLFGFTERVKNRFSHEQRVELIEMLWEVVYADGRVHAFESNLIRRVAGLLHVPDQESGAARKRVLARREAEAAAQSGGRES